MTSGSAASLVSDGVDENLKGESVPRVLVLSHAVPHTVFAGSILLQRLLQRWPVEHLLVAGPRIPDGAEKLACDYVNFQPRWSQLDVSRFAKFSRVLTVSGVRSVFTSFPQAVINFQPRVVLTVMQNLGYCDTAYWFSKKYSVPMVLIVHDDPEDFERAYAWSSSGISRRFAKIYRHATRRLCVSPEMRDKLRERYGVEGEVLYPNRSESLVPRAADESLILKKAGHLTIGYAGAMNYGYGARLEELTPVLQRAGALLRVYSRQKPEWLNPEVVTYVGGFATPEAIWEKIKTECDAVILPYCYEGHGHQELYRTHFPSKLPEYLALGMPVVIGGPDYATGVKWGLRNPEASIVITEQTGETWLKELNELTTNAALRVRLAEGAVTAGNRDFEPAKIRATFVKAVCAAAKLSAN